LFYWNEAIKRPGAAQMQYIRALIESRPYFSRVPDASLIADPLSGADRIAATRGDGYAFVYSAQGRKFAVNMRKISGAKVTAWRFHKSTVKTPRIHTFENTGTKQYNCPTEGFGSDWVLVLDDASRNFTAPGSSVPST
jgi:hypothetical protein